VVLLLGAGLQPSRRSAHGGGQRPEQRESLRVRGELLLTASAPVMQYLFSGGFEQLRDVCFDPAPLARDLDLARFTGQGAGGGRRSGPGRPR